MNGPGERRPARIVVTVSEAGRQADPALAARKIALYVAAVERHGAIAVVLDSAASGAAREAAFGSMDGLLLTGGADLSPARYGRAVSGAVETDPGRDELEARAWTAAAERFLPVLGICRGAQAINVFSGGTLLQDVPGHAGRPFGSGPAASHPLRLVPGTRLARILFPSNVRGGVLTVNTFHHQGIRANDVAPGLLACAWATSPAGDLVEGLESAEGRFVVGVQCHPERTDSTPPAFDRLFRVFVDAARGPLGGRTA